MSGCSWWRLVCYTERQKRDKNWTDSPALPLKTEKEFDFILGRFSLKKSPDDGYFGGEMPLKLDGKYQISSNMCENFPIFP